MADPIDLITANPDTNNPANFATQADLAWTQLKAAIPQINSVAIALNLNDASDVSTTTNVIGNGAKTFTVSANKSWVKGQILNIADAANPTSNIMTAAVSAYSGTSLSVGVLQFLGTEGTSISSWVISLSAMPTVPTVTSELKLTSTSGFGSTNTAVLLMSTVATNTATADLLYDNSATLGTTITVLTKGWYRLRAQATGTTPMPGVTVNCTELTTLVNSLADPSKLLMRLNDQLSGSINYADATVFLNVNDIVRFQRGTGVITTANANVYISLQKLSLQGVSGVGSGSGAPSDAEYVVAVANSTLTNDRVATSTTSIIADSGTTGQMQYKRAALVGDVIAAQDSNTLTIPNNTIDNLKASDMGAYTLKGNATGASADPQDIAVPVSSVVGRDSSGNIVGLTMGTNMSIVAGALTAANSGGGGAPTTAEYIVASTDATLTNERVITTTNSVVVNTATAGQLQLQREALTGDVTAARNGNATTIANKAVTNAKMADMLANTVKINNAAITGTPVDLAMAASTVLGRDDAGNVAALTLGDKMTATGGVLNAIGGLTSGDLTTAGVVTFDGTNFKNYAGTTIILGTNPTYTWAAKPAASSVSAGTIIRINTSSFGGTHKHSIGPIAESDGTRWMPAGGRQLLCRGSGSVATPLATASGTSATAFNIAAQFSLPANFFEYVGSGLQVIGWFQKTGADANASSFTLRIGTLSTASIDSIVGVTTAATANRETKLDSVMRVTTLGAANTAVFTSGSLQPNANNTNSLSDKSSGVFDTTALMYVVPAAACSASVTATHALVAYEVWWIA